MFKLVSLSALTLTSALQIGTEAALKRINEEFKEIQNDPPSDFSAGPRGDDMFKWSGKIIGPEDSPYAGGVLEMCLFFLKCACGNCT